MIIDIFHGEQFTTTLSQFKHAMRSWDFVRKECIVGDRIALTLKDSLGNEHTYVFAIQSEAFDEYANQMAPN